MPREEYAGAAAKTKLASGINNTDTAISVNDASGWPDGGTGNFVISIGRGTASQEKILCASRTGTTITVATSGRGYDGTTAQSHATGDDVEHTISAAKLDDLDDHVYDTTRDDHTQYLNGARHDARDHSAALASAVLADLGNVAADAPSTGDALVWDGSAWGPAEAGGLTKIAVTTLASAAAGITFSSIPGTFRSLLVICRLRMDGATPGALRVRFNSDTGNNYDYLFGTWGAGDANGSVTNAASGIIAGNVPASGEASGVAAAYELLVADYANTAWKKALTGRGVHPLESSSFRGHDVFGGWRSTTAITAINLSDLSGNNFAAGSVASLYGVPA